MNPDQEQRFLDGLPLCSICDLPIYQKDNMTLKCNHIFHKQCIQRWLGNVDPKDTNNAHNKCPLCRSYIEVKRTDDMIRRNGGKRRRKRKTKKRKKHRKSRKSRKY
jgi:hypothetical protein